MQGNKIRFGEQLLQPHILNIQTLVRIRIICKDIHTEALENTDHGLSDFTGSYYAGHFMEKIRSHQSVDIHVEFPGSSIRLMRKPVYREQHGHGEFRHRFRRVAGHPQDFDFSLCRLHIHMVIARASQQQRLYLIFI